MRITTALFLCALCARSLSAAGRVDLSLTTDGPKEHESRVARFSAECGEQEVLVLRSERWEDGRPVLEAEIVVAGAEAARGLRVSLHAPDDGRWQLDDFVAEQHLVGLALSRWNAAPARLFLALDPMPRGARRRYLFSWEARVEKWAEIKRVWPDLPAPSAEGWSVRRIRYAAQAETPSDAAGGRGRRR